ncbi:GTP-binding protein [Polaromonas sp.]|uniref:GTP-binding protein n=1 Tax=Polaromonas sp. TaxID=1869339 RepID=UPI003BAA9E56
MHTQYKIVFAGPVGAGKTTAIQSLSDIEVVSTEARASDVVRQLKSTTTVAMDYGLMKLDNGDQVRLYGAPGQKRFDFMWDILTQHALGLVVLVSAAGAEPVGDLRQYLDAFRALIDRTAVVVGVTHTDKGDPAVRQLLIEEMHRQRIPPCVMDADARSRPDVAMLVKCLLFSIDPFAGALLEPDASSTINSAWAGQGL